MITLIHIEQGVDDDTLIMANVWYFESGKESPYWYNKSRRIAMTNDEKETLVRILFHQGYCNEVVITDNIYDCSTCPFNNNISGHLISTGTNM